MPQSLKIEGLDGLDVTVLREVDEHKDEVRVLLGTTPKPTFIRISPAPSEEKLIEMIKDIAKRLRR